jgi:gamma-glutamyltranspeptidase / glutathione hydrolase
MLDNFRSMSTLGAVATLRAGVESSAVLGAGATLFAQESRTNEPRCADRVNAMGRNLVLDAAIAKRDRTTIPWPGVSDGDWPRNRKCHDFSSEVRYLDVGMVPRLTALVSILLLSIGCERGPLSTASLRVAPSAPVSSMGPPSAPSASNVAIVPPAASQAPPQLPPNWPYPAPVTVKGEKGMVVTDNALATQVGRDVLVAGGNAVDAAVATAFALAVAYPTAGNIGGGGFAVTLTNGEARALDFRETAPAAATRDMYTDANGRPRKDAHLGIRSVAVPGSVAGLWELHRTLGSKKMNWAELLAPAIRLAEQGLVVDDEFVQSLGHAVERLKQSAASEALFLPMGAPPAKGSHWKNPALARVLERIAKQGRDGFYQGPTAKALLAEMKRGHGLITQTDLDAYQAIWREPLEFTYRGAKLVTMPPPSSGGVTLAMICHVVEGFDLGKLGFQSPAALHVVFEAMRRAFAARNAKLGDPDFVKMPLGELLGATWANQQRSTITPNRATPSGEIPGAGAPSGGGPHTTHFSVVDGQGNAVALTTTLNFWYGSGVTVTGAGFVLNNEMDDFAAVPGTANGFGLVQGEANAIAPRKRMLSSMAPTIVSGPDGKIILVAGAAGGPTIITTVFEELSNVLDFGLDFGVAVGAPRFHMQHLPDRVTFETDGLSIETRQRLEAMGYTLTERGHVADAPMIGRAGSEWIGVAEPRRQSALAAAP